MNRLTNSTPGDIVLRSVSNQIERAQNYKEILSIARKVYSLSDFKKLERVLLCVCVCILKQQFKEFIRIIYKNKNKKQKTKIQKFQRKQHT